MTWGPERCAILKQDGSGQLDEDELFDAFTRLGLSLQRPAVRHIISFCDADGNGKVDFREFMLLLGGKETDVANPEVRLPLQEPTFLFDVQSSLLLLLQQRLTCAGGGAALQPQAVQRLREELQREEADLEAEEEKRQVGAKSVASPGYGSH